MALVDQVNALAAAVRDRLNSMSGRLLPDGGTEGQVLVRTATGFAWADAPAGTGQPSATAPAQVSGLTVTGTGDSRTLTWAAPADGGSPITDYVIRLDGAVVADGVGTGTTHTLTGLSVGSHVVTVAAVNGVGEGPASTGAEFTVQDTAPDPTTAQRVIILSDYAGDCDDALALELACDAHQKGTIDLLGIVATSNIATSAPGIYGQLAAYGMADDIPVYAYQGSVGTYNNRISAPVRDAFGVPGQTRTAYEDDVTGLRRMLAAAPDASVKMIDIGAPVTTARLLNTPADAISPLTGAQLVAAKVVGLWAMAGDFVTATPEYNMTRDIPSSQAVYANWPTVIYAHGAEVGGDVKTGPGLNADPTVDPTKLAFDECAKISMVNSEGRRNSWDPVTVHHAIYGNGPWYSLAHQNVTINISSTGVSTWSATPAGNRAIVARVASTTVVRDAIEAIIHNTTLEAEPNTVPATPPTVQTGASISPATGPVGTTFTVGEGTYGGAIPITITGVLTQAGVDVTAQMTGDTFVSTAEGPLVWTVTATNSAGSVTSTASATVQADGGTSPDITGWVFPLDEGAGTIASSEAGDMTLYGATWAADPTRLEFNTAKYGQFPADAAGIGTDFLLGAIVRVTTTSGTQQLLTMNGDGSKVFQFRIGSGGRLEYISFNAGGASVGATPASATGLVTVGQWLLATAHVTNTTAVLRLNGVQIASGTFEQRNVAVAAGALVTVGARQNVGNISDPLKGDGAAFGIRYGATAADMAAFEADLRAIATAKGITLP